ASVWSLPENYRNRHVAILGAGVLGRRMACCWLSGGYNVHVRDPAPEQLQDCLAYAEAELHNYPKHDHVIPGKLQVFEDLSGAVAGAWLVIEAVPEKLPLKISTFAELEELAPKDAILATNSSSYASSQMLAGLKDDATKARILNTHYFMPPQAMAVELMTSGYTHPDVFPFMVQRQHEAGTHPYVARKESTGFIINRIWAAVKREVLTVLAEGVSVPEEIDALWKEVLAKGVGPCRMMDHVGLDTVALIEQHYVNERGLSPELTVDFLKINYLDKGKLGTKSPNGVTQPQLTASSPLPASAPSSPLPTVEIPQQTLPSLPSLPPVVETTTTYQPTIYALDAGLASSHPSVTSGQILSLTPSLSPSFPGEFSPTPTPLLKNLALPDGITYDSSSQTLFFTTMGENPSLPDGAVHSFVLNDPTNLSRITLIPSTSDLIHTPKQIVCEPLSQKLYIADREGMRIVRCNYDGSDVETLVQNLDLDLLGPTGGSPEENWIVGIAVAPELGKLYWTQKGPSKGGKGKIFCADIHHLMLGGELGETPLVRTDIVCLVENLPEPIDLAWDAAERYLYWTDRGELPRGNTLNRMKLGEDGLPLGGQMTKTVVEIVARGFHEAIGLALDGERGCVYVADLGGSVYKVDLRGEGKKEVVYREEGRAFTGLVVV
ncbi:hypothetical protein QBC35DRAFT_541498, partial [Podospora australis]